MIPVFDGHNDTLTRADHEFFATGREGGHLDLPRMREAGMRGGIFAIFSRSPEREEYERAGGEPLLHPRLSPPLAHDVAAADATAAAGRLLALERRGLLRVAREIADVDAAEQGDGPPAAVLHLEGVEAIDPGLEALELWYAAGLRSLGPVWSRSNAFAHGVPFVFPAAPDIGPGLTEAGRRLVHRCGELGIVVDVSHMNEAGFWDVAREQAGPIVASHSAVHALRPVPRNLTDEQLDEIGRSSGLVGIILGSHFLRSDGSYENDDMPLSRIAEHARYVADRIGPEHVGLGSDFDGTTVPKALGDVRGLPDLLEELRTAGFSDAEVRSIAWGNWRRVLAAWWVA